MSIYRGAGGSGDAVNDASSEAILTVQAKDAAIAAQLAAEAAQTAAELAETNAETAETNAETAATNAASSASAASTSASNASTSATNAANSATAAQTAETNAETAETNAAASASSASTSASNASTSATNAANSASSASTSATNASNSASAAATSASNAAASYDSFDDRYLGSKSSAPSVDNDGNALLTGALYFNTVDNAMKVWSGSAWLDAYASLSGALLTSNNLSDLTNTTTARSNLGVAIGTNVQAWDADLDTWATKTAPAGTVVGTSDSQTLINKTISGASNTITNIGNSSLTNSDITINGTSTSLGGSINVGTVTSVSALTLGTTGTDLSSTVANSTTTPVITLNVPTASASNRGALSSTDWSTFNGKQAALVSGTNIKTVNGSSLLGSGDVGTITVSYGGTGATTLTGVLKGNGTSAFTAATAGTDYVAPGTATTFTALQTFAGTSSNADLKTSNIVETITVSATAATGTINYDITTQSVLYYTTNASGNFTVNFRGSSGTSLDTLMATGESMSVSFLVTNGATPYYNSAVQVDGNSVTPKWQGGTAPTSGNASSIDVYSYVIIKTGSAAFTVLASQTQFK